MPSISPLSTNERATLKVLLRSRMTDLEHLSESRFRGMAQVDAARQTLLQDADDAAQRSGEHEVERIVGDIDSREFNALQEAVVRMQDNRYGLCCDCQCAIPFERLRAEPQALRCAACQTLYEEMSKP